MLYRYKPNIFYTWSINGDEVRVAALPTFLGRGLLRGDLPEFYGTWDTCPGTIGLHL